MSNNTDQLENHFCGNPLRKVNSINGEIEVCDTCWVIVHDQ